MWIQNNGERGSFPPVTCTVDIKLNCDVEDQPGVPCIKYSVNPRKWDWQRKIGGIEFTHYREAAELKLSDRQ